MDGRLWQGRVNLVRPWLRRRFGRAVAKLSLDAGFSCPNRDGTIGVGGCAFCPPGGSGRGLSNKDIGGQLQEGLARIHKKAQSSGKEPPAVLAYFQAYSNTHGRTQDLEALYEQTQNTPGVDGLIVSTRPDCLGPRRWDLLSRLNGQGFFWLELGLQSCHDSTLQAINRGHSAEDFTLAAQEAARRGIKLVAHVILGLPGESPEHTNATAEFLSRLPVWGVKLHSLMILEGAPLAGEPWAASFEPWSLEMWVGAAAEFLVRLPRDVLLHRLAADPGGDRLIAPAWIKDKDAALGALARYMVEQDLHQGDLCRN